MPVKGGEEKPIDRPEGHRLTLIGTEERADADAFHDDGEPRQLLRQGWPVDLTLDDLHAELRAQQARIAHRLPAVVELRASLNAGSQVAPGEHDRMLAILQPLTATVYQLCRLVDGTAHLPLVAIPLRYDLVVAAHKLVEQLDQAAQAITGLQRCRRAASKTAVKRLAEVRYALEAVERGSRQVAQECSRLIDRTNLRHYLFAS
jgi:hypothetical protein